MSNNDISKDAANDSSDNSPASAISRQSMKRSRRKAQTGNPPAAPSADSSKAPSDSKAAETHALVVSSRRKRYTDNRPVDPSPINVAQTVRMAGLRPIQASPNLNGSNHQQSFNDSPQIMNRPIASNNNPDDEEMLGYLD
jgi:hypothetical protein